MKFFEGANPRELDGEEELFKKENLFSKSSNSFLISSYSLSDIFGELFSKYNLL